MNTPLKVDLAVPIEGGPLDGRVVIIDHDRNPEPLTEIMPTGLIPSRNIVLPVAVPAGFDANIYRLHWSGEHYEDPAYRWEPMRLPDQMTPGQEEVRVRLVLTLGIDSNTTLPQALEVVHRLAECPGGPRHLAQNSDGYCNRCGHYFPDDGHPPYVPATLAEAITRTLPYRTREADQSVFDRHQPVDFHQNTVGGPEHGVHVVKVCQVCRDGNALSVPMVWPCDDAADLARRYGFDPESLVS